MTDVVFSWRDASWFPEDPDAPRRYLIAPLTYRERQNFRADLAREAGVYPQQPQMLEALRTAVKDSAPDNAAELLEVIDRVEVNPSDLDAQSKLGAIEAAMSIHPVYSELLAARQRYMGMLPWVAARHSLRGWEGEGLPAFTRVRGAVPAEVLDELPPDDLEAVGWKAHNMMLPGASALKNSEAPSPLPESQAPSTEG